MLIRWCGFAGWIIGWTRIEDGDEFTRGVLDAGEKIRTEGLANDQEDPLEGGGRKGGLKRAVVVVGMVRGVGCDLATLTDLDEFFAKGREGKAGGDRTVEEAGHELRLACETEGAGGAVGGTHGVAADLWGEEGGRRERGEGRARERERREEGLGGCQRTCCQCVLLVPVHSYICRLSFCAARTMQACGAQNGEDDIVFVGVCGKETDRIVTLRGHCLTII